MTDAAAFGGDTFNPLRDGKRLDAQLGRVHKFMSDGHWHTLEAISAGTGDPQASVSARLRDLRKPEFGGFTVLRRHVQRGLHEYCMQKTPEAATQ